MTNDDVVQTQQLIHRFWSALDRRDYQGMMALVTEDCHWQRAGQIHEGAAAILEAMEARPANLAIRHLINNVVLDDDGAGFVVNYALTAFTHTIVEGEKAPYTCSVPGMIADITTRCVRSGDKMLISRIEAAIIFRNVSH